MPKRDFETLGKSKRSYDDPDFIGTEQLLRDYQGAPIGGMNVKNGLNRTGIKAAIDQILSFEDIARQSVVIDLKQATQKSAIFDNLINLIEDITYSVWDFLSWRKVKSSLTILGGIGAGAAVGALIGTFVLPGIGTIVGGAVAPVIASVLASVGGTLGVAILGGVFGSYFGKRASDKLFKFEKRFQPSRRFTRVINKKFGIDDDTIDRINTYLYNRKESTENMIIRDHIKKLRKDFIYKASPESLGGVIRFFMKELEDLLGTEESNDKLLDFIAIKDILLKIPLLDKLPLEQRNQLQKLLNEDMYKQNEIKKSTNSFKQSVAQPVSDSPRSGMLFSRSPSASSAPPSQAHHNVSADNILKSLSENGYQIHTQNKNTAGYRHAEYQLDAQNGDAPLKFELEMDKMVTEITIATSAPTTMREEINAFVEQAICYREQTNENEVTIFADGDHAYAAQLFAALRKKGFLPNLDIEEYPEFSPERREVLKQAEELFSQQRKKRAAILRPQPK